MELKNKFLLIVFSFLAILLILSMQCISRATSETTEYPVYVNLEPSEWKFVNIPVSLQNDENSFVILKNNAGTVNVFYFNSNDYYLVCRFINDCIYCYLIDKTTNLESEIRFDTIDIEEDELTKSYVFKKKLTSGVANGLGRIELGFYSSVDVFNYDGDVVFHPAPTPVTIPTIQQVEEIPQVMEQVMTILIPVGLIIFSIGLVIFLTRFLISRVL